MGERRDVAHRLLRYCDLARQLQKSDEDVETHLDALRTLTEDFTRDRLCEHLYSYLTTLDGKASSMLTSNSIVIAVFAIIMTRQLGRFEWVVLGLGMLAAIVSAFILLWVLWVHWSTTEDLGDSNAHAFKLLRVRNSRTLKCRAAWLLAILSFVLLSVLLLVMAAG